MSGTVTPATRHLTASAAVFDIDRRRVLLIDHKAEGRRQFPGGHIDTDEAPAETAVREVLEETGVHAALWHPHPAGIPNGVEYPAPLLVVEFPAPAKPHKGEPAHHHIDELFLALADSTAPVTARLSEVKAAVWVPIDDLSDPRIRADVPVVVAEALRVFAQTGALPPSTDHL